MSKLGIDANTGRVTEKGISSSLRELDREDLGNIIALKSAELELSDAVLWPRKLQREARSLEARGSRRGDQTVFERQAALDLRDAKSSADSRLVLPGPWPVITSTIASVTISDAASLKPNPPEIAKSQEFATAARHDGLDYTNLPHRILPLGIYLAKAGASVG